MHALVVSYRISEMPTFAVIVVCWQLVFSLRVTRTSV